MDYATLCNSIPSVTQNKFFEENGYLYVPGIVSDCDTIRCSPPVDSDGRRLVGRFNFQGKSRFKYTAEEGQVLGSLARYNMPSYKRVHRLIGKVVENILGIDVFPTYFYDRFYYLGQELKPHSDRPACEISVTLQVSSNSDKPWPIWFELPDNSVEYVKHNYRDVMLLESKKNLGYSRGFNLGIKKALSINAEYMLITNNDIELDESILSSSYDITTNSSSSGVRPDEAVFTSIPSSCALCNISAEATSNSLAS